MIDKHAILTQNYYKHCGYETNSFVFVMLLVFILKHFLKNFIFP